MNSVSIAIVSAPSRQKASTCSVEHVEQHSVHAERLRDIELEPVALDEGVLDQPARALPGGVVEPGLLGLVEADARLSVDLEADAGDDLGHAQMIAGREDAGRGDGRAVAALGHLGHVHVRAPVQMAQRQKAALDRRLGLGRQLVDQAALLDEGEVALDRLVHVGAGDVVGRVIELARVERLVPVLHHDRRLAGVVLPELRLIQRLVMEVRRRLDVERRLLVARGRLVAAKPAGDVSEGLALRLEVDGLDLNGHVFPPMDLVGLTPRRAR